MKKMISVVVFLVIVGIGVFFKFYFSDDLGGSSGSNKQDQKEVAFDSTADLSIQEYTLRERKKLALHRFPGDTLDLMEFILKNYEQGSYLLDVDKTYSTNAPRSAVIYSQTKDSMRVFALIARSKKEDERTIEIKNLIGYDASFIDMDSTELGTAYFWLTQFIYSGGTFTKVWEAPVPTHGGFSFLSLEKWDKRGTPFIKILFYDAQDIGHIDYNYFLLGGLDSLPHLIVTYEGINSKRTLADVNRDKYPDYYEFVFYDTGHEIRAVDSVAFIFKDSLYVNTRYPKQTRKYYDINFEKISNK